ncbi:hypothetical protein [Pedobacter sp. PACM 27299]|uniref:hypothetical protein n=1 Tax=Pedobacter sp. PACM 27299 TaxID=1727164 RepID=UPI000A5943B9|nr:hypothetical protein [Pedobacter sp. PACM 27299]
MIRNAILCIVMITSFLACSQKKEIIINQNPDINADNIVAEITKALKSYPSEKIYGLGYSNSWCRFDVFVNGIKIPKNFGDDMGSTGVEINEGLFKSGKQVITYKMYPLGKYEEDGTFYKAFINETDLEFDVNSYDLKNEKASNIEYMEYKVPKIEVDTVEKKHVEGESVNMESATRYKDKRFVAAGKTYYEGSFEVNLEVPYHIQPPFQSAQDLRKMDPKLLEEKLLKKYAEIVTRYDDEDADYFAKILFDRLKTYYVTHYKQKKDLQEEWLQVVKALKNHWDIQPIDHYEIAFFADGKLAKLVKKITSKEPRRKDAFWAKSEKNKDKEKELEYLFYISQGETELKVY